MWRLTEPIITPCQHTFIHYHDDDVVAAGVSRLQSAPGRMETTLAKPRPLMNSTANDISIASATDEQPEAIGNTDTTEIVGGPCHCPMGNCHYIQEVGKPWCLYCALDAGCACPCQGCDPSAWSSDPDHNEQPEAISTVNVSELARPPNTNWDEKNWVENSDHEPEQPEAISTPNDTSVANGTDEQPEAIRNTSTTDTDDHKKRKKENRKARKRAAAERMKAAEEMTTADEERSIEKHKAALYDAMHAVEATRNASEERSIEKHKAALYDAMRSQALAHWNDRKDDPDLHWLAAFDDQDTLVAFDIWFHKCACDFTKLYKLLFEP